MTSPPTVTTQEFPELSCYGLAGHSAAPRDLVHEARRAEELGLGSVFLSERFATKDAGVMAGMVAGVTDRVGIATAATNPQTRHPLVTATMAVTAHRASGGRYALGLGRGFDMLFDIMGLPRVTGASLEDTIGILRTLWSGGSVVDHDGPAGRFPYLFQDPTFDEHIPVLMTAIGDRSLALAGRIADGVVLHTCLTDQTLERSVGIIRAAAEEAGRDPASVRVWAVLGIATDLLSEEALLRKTVGRLATYLQGYGEVLVAANGWDGADLESFRSDELVSGYRGGFDTVGATEELTYLRDRVLPAEWLATFATGSPATVADRVADQFGAGADSVVLHGATPDEIAPVLPAWRDRRPGPSTLPVNPGRMS